MIIRRRPALRHYTGRKVLRVRKVPKMGKAPVMTPEEKEGADLLTQVWDRLQQHGKAKDKLKTPRAKAKYIDGEVLWEAMFLVSKIRGRIRAGKYRNQ